MLNASATTERFVGVGKSHGGGAIKVEPRALERLPLCEETLGRAGFSIEASRVPLKPAA
ncbi:MAG: hypothetical protein M9938_01915 [Solirubrobacterales bacterium]|nr:hypothetical protein [Solirubrobacterales bacterium]